MTRIEAVPNTTTLYGLPPVDDVLILPYTTELYFDMRAGKGSYYYYTDTGRSSSDFMYVLFNTIGEYHKNETKQPLLVLQVTTLRS